MFIFYEFRPFCIDNARVIYRKIRYLFTGNPFEAGPQPTAKLPSSFLTLFCRLVAKITYQNNITNIFTATSSNKQTPALN